jgi:hypothetical protein
MAFNHLVQGPSPWGFTGVYNMCYECKCKDKNFVLTPSSITEETFKRAAKAANITLEEAKKNTLKLLQQELGSVA